jgi:murein DD-endopeptidase MepM/ murein hydrolase activator NlpD
MRFLAVLLFAIWALPALSLEIAGNPVQGGMMVGLVAPGTSVAVNGTPVRVSPEGHFVFGFGRDYDKPVTLSVNGIEQPFSVASRKYNIQRIDGLPPKMVTPPEKTLKRIRRENGEIARIRALDTPEIWFTQDWIWPSTGIISGVYGSQRVLNGKPRRPHFGIDIAVPTGTPVVAPTDAIVRMAETDLYFTGGTVMLDHGHGVTSVYSHLSRISVTVGQTVHQGEKIGEVGSTGRSTGPHLDWRVNWFKERLDPALLAGPMPGG